jgi:transposase
MLYNHFTEKLIGLQGITVKKVYQNPKSISIMLEMQKMLQKCPCCGCSKAYVHDYRKQIIKDIPAFGKHVILILRKRRYSCKDCKKRFFEENKWLPRYHRITNRLAYYIINKLSEVSSFTSVAKEVNLSTSTVIRIFDMVSTPSVSMPKVLSIDEFKGNTDGEKYQCIITDPVNKRILDILPARYKHTLSDYFKRLDRSKTTHFVSDMWSTYKDISDTYFKNATFVVDRYHFVRQVIWAFEAVRKEEQKKFAKTRRVYFKRSKSLLSKQYKHLSAEQKQQVDIMLYASENILKAYSLKEQYFDFLDSENSIVAKKKLSRWVLLAENSGLKSFADCARTMQNWSLGILNSFDCPYTNGFTEGVNNKIKVIKRNAYGYRNFERFRKRILHVFSNNNQNDHKNIKVA